VSVKTCTKCLIPKNRYAALFDESGVCNYCSYYETHKEEITVSPERKAIMRDRFARVKGKYEYDAAVGVSGGKDSAYMLYKLVKDYGLKVLVTTVDNGFFSPIAKQNVDTLINVLQKRYPGQITYEFIPWEERISKLFFKRAFMRFGEPCAVCFASHFSMARLYWRRIPYHVVGRSPFQLYRFYDGSNLNKYRFVIDANLEPYDAVRLHKTYVEIDLYMKRYLSVLFPKKEEREEIYNYFYANPHKEDTRFVPEVLNFYLYEHYEEGAIRKALKEELGYVAMPTHHDCNIHLLSKNILYRVNSFKRNDATAEESAMIRQGKLTQDELSKIVYDRMNEPLPPDELKTFCTWIGISTVTFWIVVYRTKMIRIIARLIPNYIKRTVLKKYFLR